MQKAELQVTWSQELRMGILAKNNDNLKELEIIPTSHNLLINKWTLFPFICTPKMVPASMAVP